MELLIAGAPVFLYTGGGPFDASRPAVILIHGAGHDHSVWNFQARRLVHQGFGVIAPDLPAHGRSGGAPLESVEALADWLAALLDALGVERAALAGHSMGSLVALEAAARLPERVTKLVLIGSVAPMPVAEPLLEAARTRRAAAHAMINQWSYTPRSQLGASALPGMSLTGLNLRLMERQREDILATDLAACNAYLNGLAAAASVRSPTLMICGERDQMTPQRAVKPLFETLVNTVGSARMKVVPGCGHAMIAEAPDAVSDALQAFLAAS